MNCKKAEKWILLKDAGELAKGRVDGLNDHVNRCENCRQFSILLTEAKAEMEPKIEPPLAIVQEILREARRQVPEKKTTILSLWKPAFATAAAVMIGLGIFLSNTGTDQVGLELFLSDSQLLDTDEQVLSIMNAGLSEDDLAFNFLMTFDG